MTHLPYIAGSYALGILIPVGFALSAWLRLGRRAGGWPRSTPGQGPGQASAPARQPAHAPGGRHAMMTRKRRRLWILVACGVGFGSATALTLSAFSSNLVFFVSPSDLAKQPDNGRSVRLGGLVKEGSVHRETVNGHAGRDLRSHRRQRHA